LPLLISIIILKIFVEPDSFRFPFFAVYLATESVSCDCLSNQQEWLMYRCKWVMFYKCGEIWRCRHRYSLIYIIRNLQV